MSRTYRRTWGLFLGGAAALVVGMAALSASMLRSESRQLEASAEESHAARLRAAAAAMDRWLGPVLAREAGRHHSDYASYRAPRRAFTSELVRLPEGSVLEPSPLLGHEAEAILLHFEWSPETGARSPQVPMGRERELALSSGLSAEALRDSEERLESLVARLDLPALAQDVRGEAAAGATQGAGARACLASDSVVMEGPLAPSLLENEGEAIVGPLVPRWSGDELVLARDAWVGGHGSVQVVVLDWPALSKRLVDEGASDVAGARLVPGASEGGVTLATLPATLVADAPVAITSTWTPARARLAIAWIAGLVSLGAIGVALRTSLAHAERRARFAAAVSHELRTPLTTLRMYSEMLADGVVTDPTVRQEYLETIQAESARLASLVENVLLHARIERRPGDARRRMTVGELVVSIEPVLRRRADEAHRPLMVDVRDEELEVEVDRDAIERVLFNLVDNACKHGADAQDRTLRLDVRRRGGVVDLQVRDHGPGIPRALGTAVFEAFRRGDETGAPGAGLGLALSRSLARELRGELSLVPSDDGACFRLSLRLA